jgi:hypothetical protein
MKIRAQNTKNMKPAEILDLLRRRIAENPVPTALSRAIAKEFPPERIAEFIDRLPPASREKIITEFLVEKPVRRITRIIREK